MNNGHVLHSPQRISETPALPQYMKRTEKMVELMQQHMATSAGHRLHETISFADLFDMHTLGEYMKFQQAIFTCIVELQKKWIGGIEGILNEYNEMQVANTLSKHIGQEGNTIGQCCNLIIQQTISWVEMLENIQTDYNYLIWQKKSGFSDVKKSPDPLL